MTSLQAIVSSGLNWLRSHNCLTIAAFCLISCLLWACVTIANHMGSSGGFNVDRAILLALRAQGMPPEPLGGARVQDMMAQLTSFGDHAVLTVIVIVAGFYLMLSGRLAAAYLVAGVATSGALLINVLKTVFARQGHDLDYHHDYHTVEVWANSFPSGHATIAAIVYLTLGCMLASERKTHALKGYVIAMAVTVTVVVGVTRVFLGVHYPTDVFGGWAIGAAWTLACMVIAYRVRHTIKVKSGA